MDVNVNVDVDVDVNTQPHVPTVNFAIGSRFVRCGGIEGLSWG